MALDAIARGVVSGNGAEVNSSNELRVALSTATTTAGYAKMLDGSGLPTSVTENQYLRTSNDTMMFFEQVEGSALNTNLWTYTATTMALAQTNGFIVLNSGAITTASTNVILNSIRTVPFYGDQPIRFTFNMKATSSQANATTEIGYGIASGTSAPTDGAFFRWTPAGTFVAVVNNNGSEVTSASLTAPANNAVTLLQIVTVEDNVQFYVADVLVATIPVPNTQAYPVNNGRQTVFARVYTGGSAPAVAPQLQIGQVSVIQEVLNQNKLWKETLAALGRGCYQAPLTAFGQTSNFANSSAPTSATLSNTAAGYTTLGGKWQFAAVAGAATDFALFGYQVPTQYQLNITSISISAMNTGAAVATTASVLEWGIGVNSSAVSLATTDAVGPPQTWAPRRIAIGEQSFAIGAAIGATATDIVRTFDPPLVVDANRFFHVILQLPIGTATASQVLRGTVTVTGYFE